MVPLCDADLAFAVLQWGQSTWAAFLRTTGASVVESTMRLIKAVDMCVRACNSFAAESAEALSTWAWAFRLWATAVRAMEADAGAWLIAEAAWRT